MAEQRQNAKMGQIPILLIAGVMSPHSKGAARARLNMDRDGGKKGAPSYLAGVQVDLGNVDKYLQNSKTFYTCNIVQNTKNLEVKDVIKEMNDMLYEVDADVKKKERKSPMVGVYYSGHGCSNGGDWCFKDGDFSFKFLESVLRKRGNIKIFSDSCFSGDWAVKLKKWEYRTRNVWIFAGSVPGASALDGGDEGGMATAKWLKLFPKLFDDEANSYDDVMEAMHQSYGCCAKIDDDGEYHYIEFRDAHAEYKLQQGMKGISLANKGAESDGDDSDGDDSDADDDYKAEAVGVASSGVTCSMGHPLRFMTQAQLVAEKPGYANGVGCDRCGKSAKKVGGSAHCSRCEYDLCPQCFIELSAEENGSSYKPVEVEKTCDEGHPLYKLNLVELNEYSDYPMAYICDGCFEMSTLAKGYDHAHHCPLCRFDLCPKCVSK